MALLDINVLVALFDPEHVHHEAAHSWFARERTGGWATCPITENGVVRVLSNSAYTSVPEPPAKLLERLRTFCESGNHTFWADDVSLREVVLAPDQPLGHRRLTDLYLLALAIRHSGRLATFDRSIPLKAISGAPPECLDVIPA